MSVDGFAETTRTAEAAEVIATPKTEEALAQLISHGDVAAWETFFDQYAPWAYRFAYHHLGGNQADAEDLCSDILMVAARGIKGFDSRKGTLDSWMLGLARHRLSHFCRKRRKEAPFLPAVDALETRTELDISDPWTEASNQRDLVNCALASLPQRQAAVLIGKYVSGYSVDELANHLQTTSKAVESLLSRARTSFRSTFACLLEKSGSGGEDRD